MQVKPLELLPCLASESASPQQKTQAALQLHKAMRSVTIQQCVDPKTETLAQLVRQNGYDEMLTALSTLIATSLKHWKVKDPMTPPEIMMLTVDFLDDYKHETLQDFMLVFRNARKGKYGTVYNRVDGSVIIDWLKLHLDEKVLERESYHKRLGANDPQNDQVYKHLTEKQVQSLREQIVSHEKPTVKKIVKSSGEHLNYVRSHINEFSDDQICKSLAEVYLSGSTASMEDYILVYSDEIKRRALAKDWNPSERARQQLLDSRPTSPQVIELAQKGTSLTVDGKKIA